MAHWPLGHDGARGLHSEEEAASELLEGPGPFASALLSWDLCSELHLGPAAAGWRREVILFDEVSFFDLAQA